jgi:hypothetical protein
MDLDTAEPELDSQDWVDLCWKFLDSLNSRLARGADRGSVLYTNDFQAGRAPSISDGFTLQAVVSAIDVDLVEELAQSLAESARYEELHAEVSSF